MSSFIAPEFGASHFTCPHCHVCSQMSWVTYCPSGMEIGFIYDVPHEQSKPIPDAVAMSKCVHCGKMTVWCEGEIVYPQPVGVDPSEDMPESVKELFVEAQRITYLSPRSACALLRVSLERLCDSIAELHNTEGFDHTSWLKTKIKSLGLPPELESIFMTVKNVGDSSAHGNSHNAEIDFSGRDSVEVAQNSAQLVNALVQILISPFVIQRKLQESFKKK